jgi:hypothetical protein
MASVNCLNAMASAIFCVWKLTNSSGDILSNLAEALVIAGVPLWLPQGCRPGRA